MRQNNRIRCFCALGLASVVALAAGVMPSFAATSPSSKKHSVIHHAPPYIPSSPNKVAVDRFEIAPKLMAYVGGGTNIDPPDTFGGGDAMPMISMSGGSSFLAGEINSKDGKTQFVKITVTATNPTQSDTSFKIGDVKLVSKRGTVDDFVGVGYGSKLCAMGDADKLTVKKIVVTIPPGGSRTLSYAFPLFDSSEKQQQIVLGHAAPVSFTVN